MFLGRHGNIALVQRRDDTQHVLLSRCSGGTGYRDSPAGLISLGHHGNIASALCRDDTQY
jgi:hypothetical protein